MPNAKLGEAIAQFKKGRPTDGNMKILDGRFNPKKYGRLFGFWHKVHRTFPEAGNKMLPHLG